MLILNFVKIISTSLRIHSSINHLFRLNSQPTCRGQSTLFWLRTTASDLEALILIPVTSHLAVNRPSESWRSLFDEANRTTSSANSRDRIQRPPNPTPSTTWLRLEILSIQIMNRPKGHPWWRPTLTAKGSDLLLAM